MKDGAPWLSVCARQGAKRSGEAWLEDLKTGKGGASPAVQWLRVCASTAGDVGLIPGRGTKIQQASEPKKQREREEKRKKKRQGGRMAEQSKRLARERRDEAREDADTPPGGVPLCIFGRSSASLPLLKDVFLPPEEAPPLS